MMTLYQQKRAELQNHPATWVITGVAGFIGSNLLEELLLLNQSVVGLDNFSTGHQSNLEDVRKLVTPEQWARFRFISGDITSLDDCRSVCADADYVLHQAALGSVPRSIADPINTNHSNVTGFLNMLVAAREASVSSFTYAASSSTYGDHPSLPKKEDIIGAPLSPYAVTKYVNELYAGVFARVYNFDSIGLRYFNVFGKRQDPNGAYAAVIPKWISSLLSDGSVVIYGDGETSRDFCYVDNAVQANILSATAQDKSKNQIYNVACGAQTSLNSLFNIISDTLENYGYARNFHSEYRDYRLGDVRHSLADISKASNLLGYNPEYTLIDGLSKSIPWYIKTSKIEDQK